MSWIFRPRWRAKFGFGPRGTVACVQGWDGWVRSSTRRTSSVIRYLTVVCRIPTGWFNRIRKSLISLFLSGWSSQIFQISSTSRFASIYLDQEEEEWKQMLAEAPVLDVSTSDFWFFAASRDLTLRLGMLLLGWFCRLFPAIFGWCASWSKFLTLVDIYIYIQSPPRMSYHIHPFLFRPNLQTEPSTARQIIWCQLLQPSRNCLRPTCKPLQPISADLAKDSRWFHW